MYIRVNERFGGDVHGTAVPAPFFGGIPRGYLGETAPAARTTCAGYQRGEVAKSLTDAGHLTPDVIQHARGLLVRDFGVDWRHVKPSVANEPALRVWLNTLVQVVRANPTTTIRIVGFSDCVGRERRNNTYLRRERALRVRQLLQQVLGNTADWKVLQPRITFTGAAPAGEYIADNSTVEGRATNRGVLIEHTRTVSFEPHVVQPSPAAQRVPCPPRTCTPGRFLPSTHGFKFTNAKGFDVKIPLPSPLPSIPANFGFCGGMSAAALDYFLACVPIPSTTTVPVSGDRLFRYLWDRQRESIDFPSFGIAMKFLEWTYRPDTTRRLSTAAVEALGPAKWVIGPVVGGAGVGVARLVTVEGLQELTVRHFLETVKSISFGRPVVLGLIYGYRTLKIWDHSHQVLAYGKSVKENVTDIRVYDPNYPRRDDAAIRCELLEGGARVRCGRLLPSGETVRGFFIMPIAPKTPPCLP